MQKWSEIRGKLKSGELDRILEDMMYGTGPAARSRLTDVMEGFQHQFGAKEDTQVTLCSAPGRTEICGNHTDHQHGHVLAAAVSLDILACAAPNGTNAVRFCADNWPLTVVSLDNLKPQPKERETTSALIRGIMAQAAEHGYPVSGFDAYAVSDVLPGSGLSSSAACEVLLGTIVNHLFCRDELDAVTIARMGQQAENQYFGKPSGLMDQMASSVGGTIAIDFFNASAPLVRPVTADLSGMGLALCILDSGASHAFLTDEYAMIQQEMGKVAAFFGKQVLRDVLEEEVLSAWPKLSEAAGDRAVLRALHFYREDRRAVLEADALANEDAAAFLELVRQSGRSSWELLQNITPTGSVEAQHMAVALTAAELALEGHGACRVHGGGFAGTIQAFVPISHLTEFQKKVEKMLGKGCCHVLRIRSLGGIVILP